MGQSSRNEVKLMTVRQPRYSKEEFARRGDEIYESQVRLQVEEGNHGKIVAINLETGDFEVDASEIVACDQLEARHPDVLGNGSECVFNVYEVVVVWDGVLLTIPVDEADSEPLVGMSSANSASIWGRSCWAQQSKHGLTSPLQADVLSFFVESERLLVAGERER